MQKRFNEQTAEERYAKELQAKYAKHVPYEAPKEEEPKAPENKNVIIGPDFIKTTVGLIDSLSDKVKQFMDAKSKNPHELFGKKDSPFSAAGFLRGYMHAHINVDLSIVYKVEGNLVYIYGVYPHKVLGTGQPPNLNKQKSAATKFANTQFDVGE